MTDLTPVLNELLRSHNARATANKAFTVQNIDEFLKEAYRIVRVSCLSSEPLLTDFIELTYSFLD